MKACILERPGFLEVRDVPDPRPGAGDLVVKVRAALTCGTDLKAFRRGHPKMPCPTLFGHEFSGEIVHVGKEVQGFSTGDAIMSANTGPCSRCFYCERGQENLCESLMEQMILGAYAEYVLVPDLVVKSNVYLKPDSLSFEQAALLEPLSSVCFGLTQVPECNLRPDSTVVLIGAGPIALLWLVALKARGVENVIVLGRRRHRLEWAQSFGVRATAGEGENAQALVHAETEGRGADLVVECTGLPEVWNQAPNYARRGGTVVLFGGCKTDATVELSAYRLHYDGVSVVSPFHFRPRDVATSYALLGRSDTDWSKFITSQAELDEVPAVFERFDSREDVKCAILPHGG